MLISTLTKDLDPLSPESPLLVHQWAADRHEWTDHRALCDLWKGPATGLWAESNIGGFWGPELRKAGYDGLWITGKAQGQVYVWIKMAGSRSVVRRMFGVRMCTRRRKLSKPKLESKARESQ
jgi:aldehyde:ferredoxin oxidoreductase